MLLISIYLVIIKLRIMEENKNQLFKLVRQERLSCKCWRYRLLDAEMKFQVEIDFHYAIVVKQQMHSAMVHIITRR